MPLQRFRPTSGRCKLCKGEVEISINSSDPLPEECPKCGQAIEHCPNLSAPVAKILKTPSPSNAKAAGFQVYKRLGKGEYEKQ
ncbi:MAG: hypothetical protein ACI92G_003837 [Candidatus Pelagisphaera sp.]|jgi:hypothetical protein